MTCATCDRTGPVDVPGVCPGCGTTARISARAWLEWVVPGADDHTPPATRPDPLEWPGYDRLRDRAARDSGTDESVRIAIGTLRGSDVAVVALVWDFAFLGGSMGADAGDRIAHGFDLAREIGLPVLLAPSTGGARMQEGMASLVQMTASTVASRRHAAAGLGQVAVLRDPTTGGVFASHANLADVILAEPGTTMGFAGPRVARAMTGGDLPAGSHTARGARASGLVDALVARADLPASVATILAWMGGHDADIPAPEAAASAGQPDVAPTATSLPASAATGTSDHPDRTAWDEVTAARAPDRLRAPAHLAGLSVAFELHGDRAGSDDLSVRPVLAWLDGQPVMVVAMDPTRTPNVRPGGYRKAWRGLRLAGRLGIPVVTLVDTPGADASASSEAAGIANHVATSFAEMLATPTPIVAVVIGEGGSGGAMALAAGDRLLIQEHAIFSVIAPEGAAAILHRDSERAAEVAELLDPTAQHLFDLGIADEVIPEPAGAEVATLWGAVTRHLSELDDATPASRADRWRHPLP